MSNFSQRKARYPTPPRSRGAHRDTNSRSPRQGRSIVVLLLLLLLWSVCLGLGLAQATEPRAVDAIAQTSGASPIAKPAAVSTTAGTPIGTVDVVSNRYKTGQDLYLQACASCHVGIPPAVMPVQTWKQLLQDPQHYGVTLQPLVEPNLQIVWEYVRTFSRPLMEDEDIPYRIYQSRFFKALHPRVKLPTRAGLTSCVSCHPGGDKYNFRSLSAEWQNAP